VLRRLIGRTLDGHVTSVVDGDTVDVRLFDGQAVRVRLEGIDAPERGAPLALEARNAARVLLFGQDVSLRATAVDRYGRLVARVSVQARDSSLELVRAGLACHFRRYSSDAGLARAQQQARAAAVGVWAAGARRPAACDDERAPGGR
jgi:endonuclease YncB( thermonuclease family)